MPHESARCGQTHALVTSLHPGTPPYHLYTDPGVLTALPSIASKLASSASTVVLIFDANVALHYAERVTRGFGSCAGWAGKRVLVKLVPPGEASKSRQMRSDIEDWLIAQRCGRDTILIAIGGGVTGDLVGCIASAYSRGIPYIQVPTSLMAMVDSAIGGKTGIDAPGGKNLIGSVTAPLAVVADPECLSTLPVRELRNGLAEVVKIALVLDGALFAELERVLPGIIRAATGVEAGDEEVKEAVVHSGAAFSEEASAASAAAAAPTQAALNTSLKAVVQRAVALKASVVRVDQLERGPRAILNFGHSIGHAIEALCQPALLHGECVAIGMVAETTLAVELGVCRGSDTLPRLRALLSAIGLPTALPSHLSAVDVVAAMAADKKNRAGGKRLALPACIGRAAIWSAAPTATAPALSHQPSAPVVLGAASGAGAGAAAGSNLSSMSSNDVEPLGEAAFAVASKAVGDVDEGDGTDVWRHQFTVAVADSDLLAAIVPWFAAVPRPPSRFSPSLDLKPTLEGETLNITVPGSKSLSNRALLIAALGRGVCRLRGLLRCDDTDVMAAALRKAGVEIHWDASDRTVATVVGKGGKLAAPTGHVDVGNSGTAARFLAAAFTLIRPDQDGAAASSSSSSSTAASAPAAATASATASAADIVLLGKPRMSERPIAPLVAALNIIGAQVRSASYVTGTPTGTPTGSAASSPSFPLRITPSALAWRGGEVTVDAGLSSQFVSALLIAAPCAQGPTTVRVEREASTATSSGATSSGATSSVVSQPYIAMTIALMRQFGVTVTKTEASATSPLTFMIPNTGYDNPPEIMIEADASSTTYPLALAALIGRTLIVANAAQPASTQGDARFATLLNRMGCELQVDRSRGLAELPAEGAGGGSCLGLRGVKTAPLTRLPDGRVVVPEAWAEARSSEDGPTDRLKGLGVVDLAEMTDSFLTLAVVAAVARGFTEIRGIANQVRLSPLSLARQGYFFLLVSTRFALRVSLWSFFHTVILPSEQRVKECNRIAAMVNGLIRAGFVASELPDGIRIEGLLTEHELNSRFGAASGSAAAAAHGAVEGKGEALGCSQEAIARGAGLALIPCFDDHRVAMAFSVLAAVCPYGTPIYLQPCDGKPRSLILFDISSCPLTSSATPLLLPSRCGRQGMCCKDIPFLLRGHAAKPRLATGLSP